jgi:hypothetical protein
MQLTINNQDSWTFASNSERLSIQISQDKTNNLINYVIRTTLNA